MEVVATTESNFSYIIKIRYRQQDEEGENTRNKNRICATKNRDRKPGKTKFKKDLKQFILPPSGLKSTPQRWRWLPQASLRLLIKLLAVPVPDLL